MKERDLAAILDGSHSFVMSAMGAAEHFAGGLHAVADDFNAAMFANGCEGVNRAFEAVEIMGNTVDDYFKAFVVVVSASFARRHNTPPMPV